MRSDLVSIERGPLDFPEAAGGEAGPWRSSSRPLNWLSSQDQLIHDLDQIFGVGTIERDLTHVFEPDVARRAQKIDGL